MYQNFQRTIENVNVIISTYSDPDGPMGELNVDPTTATVCFGSGLHAWGFTLKQFAEIYAGKFKVEPEKLMSKFWGDNYFGAKEAKKWSRKSGPGYKRCFNHFILDPIFKMVDAVLKNKKDVISK